MTLFDFIYYLTDDSEQNIEVFGCNSAETIFVGKANELETDYEILSIDTMYDKTDTIVFNVYD